MVSVYLGRLPLRAAIREGAVRLDGPTPVRQAFTRWIGLSPLARSRAITAMTAAAQAHVPHPATGALRPGAGRNNPPAVAPRYTDTRGPRVAGGSRSG